tara:strand:- start:317 stop:1318 length:1002 start_codon:yes stop_codon:yes gene_type:complete
MKSFAIPLLSIIALPTAIQANIDFRVVEKCLKETESKGCVKIPSGQEKISLSNESILDEAKKSLSSGDSADALSKVNIFLNDNKDSKEGYLLRALINEWDYANMNQAFSDLNKAIELDNKYAEAYALRGQHLYWELSNKTEAEKDLNRALELSPNSILANYFMGEMLYDYADSQYEKNMLKQAFETGNEALSYFEMVLSNKNFEQDFIIKRIFPFGIIYDTYVQVGTINFSGYSLLKELRERKKAKEYLDNSIDSFSKAIEIAPSKEDVEKMELDRNNNFWALDELYLERANAYSWKEKWKAACKDWKISKDMGNKDSQTSFRENCKPDGYYR